MKNAIIKTVLLLAVFGIILSCKKVEKEGYPITLHRTTKYLKSSEIRLFTKTGEITDPNIIDRFSNNLLGIAFTLENLDFSEHTITFLSKKVMKTGNIDIMYDLISDVPNTQSEFVFFSQKENIIDPESFEYKILKFKSPLNVNGTAPNISYKTKNVILATGSYTDLNLSILSYKIQQGPEITFRFASNQPIVFDTPFLSQLKTTDTIAVKEYIVNYKAR